MDCVFLNKILCRCCGQYFFICQSCWRGHAYCSDSCKKLGYKRCRQKRQDKYRKTIKGKKTRRRAERRRSLQQSSKKSGDATSNIISSMITSHQNQSSCEPCCHFCGKKGVVVGQFPCRKYGSMVHSTSGNHIYPSGGYYDQKNTTHQSANQKN